MTQDKHTPWRHSPWHIEEGPPAVYNSKGELVCTTSSDDTSRLIAAAPDLLALLIELVDIEGPLPGTSQWGDKARAAIARAQGGAA